VSLIGPDTPGRRLYAEWCGSPDCDRVRYYHAMNAGDRKAWEDLAERVGRDRDAGGTGARRALPGEGTGMSGVEELAEQLAVAVKALERIVGLSAVWEAEGHPYTDEQYADAMRSIASDAIIKLRGAA
jgi:hypothetical protein